MDIPVFQRNYNQCVLSLRTSTCPCCTKQNIPQTGRPFSFNPSELVHKWIKCSLALEDSPEETQDLLQKTRTGGARPLFQFKENDNDTEHPTSHTGNIPSLILQKQTSEKGKEKSELST